MDNEHFHEQQNSLQGQKSFSLTQPFLKETNNLNSASFLDDMGYIFADIQDYSTVGSDGKTLVLFKRLEEHLIRFIQEADIILGCVAWVTSEPILKALSKRKGVSIIVQKEDFLRPGDCIIVCVSSQSGKT